MIKVLIADDQALIRESLQIILSAHADIEVVGTVGDGKEVLEKLHRVRPDVILMDIRMPVMDGVLCTKAVKEQYPDVKIIILTTFDDDEYVYNALKFGASGYLSNMARLVIFSKGFRQKSFTKPFRQSIEAEL